jgi:hypothetical protein
MNDRTRSHNDRVFYLMINKTGIMFFNLFRTKVSQVNALFLGHYVDPKVFYTVQFNKVPCISFIENWKR